MSSQLPSLNPTGYVGTNYINPGNNVFKRRDPLPTDIHFEIGTRWLNTVADNFWVLGSVTNNVAHWIICGGGSIAVERFLLDDTNEVFPVAGLVQLTGDSAQGISTFTPGGNVVEFTIADSATAQKGVVQTNSVNHGVLIGGTTQEQISSTTAGTSGQILQSAGAASDPVWTTTTYPATTGAEQVLISTAANTVSSSANIVCTTSGIVSTTLQSGFSAYMHTALANVLGTVGTDLHIIFDTDTSGTYGYDIQGEYDPTTGFFTATKSGLYQSNVSVLLTNIGVLNTSGAIGLHKNESTLMQQIQFNPAAIQDVGNQATVSFSCIVRLAPADTLCIHAVIAGGVADTVGIAGGDVFTRWQVSKIA